jgi:hypothetical protein
MNSKTTTQGASFKMHKNDYIAFRIQIISKNTKLLGSNIFSIKPPENSATKGILTENPANNSWKYFVTFIKDNAVYYKNLLYFGLVKSDSNNDKYDCYFIPTTKENANNIREYKLKPKLQYIKTEIPIPTMIGKGSFSATEGSPINVNFIPGVNITIEKATYGVDPKFYTYQIPQQVNTQIPTLVPGSTTNKIVSPTDPYLPTKSLSTTIQPHIEMVNQTITVPGPPITVKQQIDVKDKLQTIVNASGGNKISINSGVNNFLNLFGSSTEETDPNRIPNSPKVLIVEYSYKVDESIIRDKFLVLNPNNGIIYAGAIFDNKTIIAPLQMDITPSCSGKNCASYTMKLLNNGKLAVFDGNNNVGSVDFEKYIRQKDPMFNKENCKVNHEWLYSANNVLNAGVTTSDINNKKINSLDGRFKLEFENKKLYFTYCYKPYTEFNNDIYYTTTSNISNKNNAQIFYLNRTHTRGMFGHKFLKEIDINTNAVTLHNFPNNHNALVFESDPNKFQKTSAYPLFKDGSIALDQNYNFISGVKSYDECASRCNTGCDHFFYINNNDNTSSCITDKILDSNPIYSSDKTHSNIASASLYKKPTYIRSTAGKNAHQRDMSRMAYVDNTANSEIDYSIPLPGPENTYIPALQNYQKLAKMTDNLYEGKTESMTGIREGMTPDFNKYASTADSNINNRVPILNTLAENYSKTQDNINNKYNETIDKLRKYEDVAQSMSSPQYNFNGTDSLIPDKFKNSDDVRPNISYVDGAKRDVGIMLVRQNTMYTLASITAMTCLILSVIFGMNDGTD